MSKISGIYEIRNKVNNRIYIGSSNNLTTRRYNHYYLLRHNKHHSRHLQRAWNKYGESNFEFDIIVFCEPDNLLKKEQLFLDEWRPEYNCAADAVAPTRGIKLSDEHKRKLSEKSKGHPNYLIKHTPEAIEKIRIASTGRKMSPENVERVRAMMKGNTNGHRTRGIKRNPQTTKQKLAVSLANSKYWGKVLSPDGVVYDITNLFSFCKEHGLSNSPMRRMFAGKQDYHKGWILYGG